MKKIYTYIIVLIMIISSACSNKNNENNYNKANPIIDYDKSSIFVDNSQTSSAILNEETEPIDPIIFDSYDKIYDFYEERAIVKNNDKYGIIDTQGNLVIPTEYDQIDHYIDGLAMVYIYETNFYLSKKGLVDLNGNYVMEPIYDNLSFPLNDGFGKVTYKSKSGLFAKNGVIIIPIEYEYVDERFTSDLLSV